MWQKRSGWRPWSPFGLEWIAGGAPPVWFVGHAGEGVTVKKVSSEKVQRQAKALTDTAGLDKFPQLAGFLSDTLYEPVDGKVPEDREPGTVWIGARGGVLHVLLKEPSQGLMMRLEVPSLQSLWKLVESALGSEGSMWESDPYARARKRKKGG